MKVERRTLLPEALRRGPTGVGEGTLGANDALRNRRFADKKRPRDFLRGQAAEHAQRQRNTRLGGKNRMTRHEHEPQQIVAHFVVDHGVRIGCGHMPPGFQFAGEFLVFQIEPFIAAQPVDRAMFRGGHEPRPWIMRDTRLRPLLERRHQSILGEFLGDPDVAHDPASPAMSLADSILQTASIA